MSASSAFGSFMGYLSYPTTSLSVFYTVGFVGALASPAVPELSTPASPGFVSACLNDCSKSAMMSSMCSVPTEIRMRSYMKVSALTTRRRSVPVQELTSVTPLLTFSSSLSCSCVVVHG